MIEVEAKKIGFYGNRRRYPKGHPKHSTFSVVKVDGSWMNVVRLEEKSEIAKLNQDGDNSPSAHQDGQHFVSDNEKNAVNESNEYVTLEKMKKDELIGIAVKCGLSENVDLTQLKKSQLIGLIEETHKYENSNFAPETEASQ